MSPEELAARQHGLIAHDQAVRFLTDKQICGRVVSGRWYRVARGVYRVAGAPSTWHQAALAACLGGPGGTVASHTTAAALAGLTQPPTLPHVIVPRAASARMRIARVHRADLDDAECTRLFGIPCTTIDRTIVDCAALLGDDPLTSLVDNALHRRLAEPRALLSAAAGRRGFARLRRALDDWVGDIEPGSAAEIRLQRQLRAWGYPRPVRQHPVRDDGRLIGLLDLAWPDRLVGVEYDSEEWHSPRRWAHDETRHAAAERLGWRLLHADKADLRVGDRRFRDDLARVWREAGDEGLRPRSRTA